ncbi:MAG TPA: acetoin utilization protein AcuC [Chloroflexia bacterium]|nr:acetoin utilization protein AcuC [Chloroflexia bacterium]
MFRPENTNTLTPDCPAAVIYHEIYDGRGFSRLDRSWGRYRAGLDRFQALGLIAPDAIPDGVTRLGYQGGPINGYVTVYRPTIASEVELATVHSLQHIKHIQEMDAIGEGTFDRYDTPVWPGVYRRAAMAVGGTLLGARLIGRGEMQHVFHVAGGLHHAGYEKVSGFCIFNDIVAAVRCWQNEFGYKRIAILDVDGHHGDGTQFLLYNEPVLTVSLHQYDGRFFPGTGAYTERGEGAGTGYSLNFPLPRFTTDAEYLPALELALDAIEAYRPEALILQFGVDGHYTDRMVRLKLSTHLYEYVTRRAHDLAHRFCEGRLLVVGGGGYEPDAVARCWSILLANLCGQSENLGESYQSLHDESALLPESDPQAIAYIQNLLQVVKQML